MYPSARNILSFHCVRGELPAALQRSGGAAAIIP
jgi:hypothetical protein